MCKQCEEKPVYEFTNQRKLCKNCFVKWFEKKFLYTIRKYKMFEKGDKVFYNNKIKDFEVIDYLIKEYSKRGTIQFSKNRPNKIILGETTDSLAYKILKGFFKKKNKKDFLIVNKKTINPLALFLNQEVELYAKLKKLKIKKEIEKKDKFEIFVDSLEKKHPEVKRAILNWSLEI